MLGSRLILMPTESTDHSLLSRRPAPIERWVRPFELFAHNKVAGAFVLMGATVLALVWANSPWADVYASILQSHARVGIGSFAIDKPILLWINDGLMAFFFFVVGLEIKREVLAGELSSLRKATLPIAAAIGGIVAPAAVYLAVNQGGAGARGWGVAMATDIAFALGVLLLLGSRVPTPLKVFLTALAIVDDICAILVIAVFYTDSISLGSLAIGTVLIGVSSLANFVGVRNSLVYFILGTLVWVAFLKSGIHATLAAVLMAMTIPARTRVDGELLVTRTEALMKELKQSGLPSGGRLLTTQQQHTLHNVERIVGHATAPLQELEHTLMPVVTFFVMPVFALANAGLSLGGDMASALFDPICLGIIAGLFIGKQAGIFGCAFIAVRLGIADLPSGVSWRQVHAVSVLAGIGFTMALFVASLAFADPAQQEIAKIGILLASLLSAMVGGTLLSASSRRSPTSESSPTQP